MVSDLFLIVVVYTKMPEYFAVYRVLEKDIEYGVRFRAEFYDEKPEGNSTGKHFMSFAYYLEGLNDSQLKMLLSIVEQKYKIRESTNWITEQNESDIIFLIEGSRYDNLGKEDAAAKLALKDMVGRYSQAKGNRQFDKTIIAPLAYCINHARQLRNLARADETSQSTPPTPQAGNTPVHVNGTISAEKVVSKSAKKTTRRGRPESPRAVLFWKLSQEGRTPAQIRDYWDNFLTHSQRMAIDRKNPSKYDDHKKGIEQIRGIIRRRKTIQKASLLNRIKADEIL